MTAEEERLEEDRQHKTYWKRWGPYLSERQWGTVREDYSENGTAWEYFPHDHARSRAYRWGEDGILGISDNHQHLCFALALWNGRDPILKERFFGLTGNEGNHGEDIKEYHFFLDSTPTHSYMKALYKYPQAAFPYEQLLEENRRRSRQEMEYELLDTGVFNGDQYFDVQVEYAKAAPEDILIKISATNRGPSPAVLHLLPTLWFRNTWSWKNRPKPSLTLEASPTSSPSAGKEFAVIRAEHPTLSKLWLVAEKPEEVLFTENETNFQRLYGSSNASPYVKDGINNYLVNGERQAVNPTPRGTKASVHYQKTLAPSETWTLRLRLTDRTENLGLRTEFDEIFSARQREADEFYEHIIPSSLNGDARHVERQAFAGMLWSKQYYHFIVQQWLDGDPASPPPPPARKQGRNHDWIHLYTDDVISMPDTWEYPWFAAWDLAFHCIPLAMIDPDFAKQQLLRLTREWYMHPNGQLPAYEWAFGDVNPPVHAWAAWRVYKIEKKMTGRADEQFLERVFQKLLMNFTWWVNRKDSEGKNIFEGGFLGLDNIGAFDRSKPLPMGASLEQSDGTSWMAMYCLNLLAIAVELAHRNPAYEDIASKFFEHFLYISDAMRHMGGEEESLWDEEDGFFYDNLHVSDGRHIRLKVHSLVGLVPLFAIQTLEVSALFKLPDFSRRLHWFMTHRPDLAAEVTCNGTAGACERRLLSIVTPDMLRRILKRMLDENEFLSPYGVRAVSRYHKDHPYIFRFNGGEESRVDYEPAESTIGLFGGNSNWRGPIWMPMNFLLLESLQKFHHYLGDEFKVECPTGSGQWMTLQEVATELGHRLMGIFLRDKSGRRAVFGGTEKFQSDPHWKDHLLFYEYFHGDNGAGLGASHQTGWTGLIAKLLQQCGEYCSHHQHSSPEPSRHGLSEEPLMKAIAMFPKTKEVKLVDHPEPRIVRPTDVKLKIHSVGVCGTDREIWSGQYGDPPAGSDYLITGHESFGQIVEVGPAVQTVKVGDYAVLTVRRGCPENCISCANDQPDFCFTGHFTERGIKQAHGYMAEYVVDEEKYVNIIPPELKDVAVLLEPLTITEKAIIQMYEIQSRLHWECRIDQGVTEKTCRNALILGAGPVGCLAALALRNLNMKTTVVARTRPPNPRASLLARFGVEYISTEDQTPAQIAHGIGNIDLILEATGAAKVAFDFLQVLGTNGLFIFTGVPAPMKDITLDAGTMMRHIVLQNKVVLGTVNAPKQAFQDGIQDLQAFSKKWPQQLSALITGRLPYGEFQQTIAKPPADEIKTVLVFEEAAVPAGR